MIFVNVCICKISFDDKISIIRIIINNILRYVIKNYNVFESTKNQQTTKAIVVGVSFVKVDYINL